MSRVLIVDDSLVTRQILREELEQNGHSVAGEAANGGEAVSLFRKSKPDAVLMDITMDDMDGLEAIRRIREINSRVVIIVVSALAEPKIVEETRRLGAADFLPKPFTPDDFRTCISRHL